MSDDRTMPMQQPDWSPRKPDFDDQETVFADQESVTPPTLPLGDQGPGFVRSAPADEATPSPFAPAPGPFGPPQPSVAPDQTMLISERPTPVFAWLVVVDGPDRGSIGTVHTLRPDTTMIGRVSGNHVVLRDDTCSSQHARIRIEGQEDKELAYVLYDMGSSNGTFVGDRESYRDEESRKYRHRLQDGDYLLIGETTLVFKKL
jgi:hypothetical protein